MKTSKIFFLILIIFGFSCTDQEQLETSPSTNLQIEKAIEIQEIINNNLPDDAERVSLQNQDQINRLVTENRFGFSNRSCEQEIIQVYWHRGAESDFVLRQEIRETFMKDFGLDTHLGAFPETVETNTELWIFYDEDGHPCHTQGVMSTVNNNGNGHVTTDDD